MVRLTTPVIGTIGATSTDEFAETADQPAAALGDLFTGLFDSGVLTGEYGQNVGEDARNFSLGLFDNLKPVLILGALLAAVIAVGQLFDIQVG